MLVTNWKEIIDSKDWLLKNSDHVYEILNGDGVVIYIGKSINAHNRLLSHVGMGNFSFNPTGIGQYLIHCYPAFLSWTIKIYEPCDYEPLTLEKFEIKQIREISPSFNYQHVSPDCKIVVFETGVLQDLNSAPCDVLGLK